MFYLTDEENNTKNNEIKNNDNNINNISSCLDNP